ncbi:MAG TPA: hypothetical protein VFZ23_17540 [Pyrinomonadaceae bacterium]
MKRCPECRRDYYDDSLLYCLDDGTALLEGPASIDETATAIQGSLEIPRYDAAGVPPSGSAFPEEKTQILEDRSTDRNPRSAVRVSRSTFFKRVVVVPVLIMIIALGAFAGYRYFVADSRQISSIAVLPFANAAGDRETEFLSDGIAVTLINDLARMPAQGHRVAAALFATAGERLSRKRSARN